MKTAKLRDEMVERAKKALTSFPSFLSLPVAAKQGNLNFICTDVNDANAYAQAVYEICSEGDVIGRSPNSSTIIGMKVTE